MSRNYAKEAAWQKEKYIELRAKLPRDMGERFKKALENNNIAYTDWLKKHVLEFLGEE